MGEINPYAAPADDADLPTPTHPNPDLERVRREHINAESNVKTVGFLLYLGGSFSLVVGLTMLAQASGRGLILVAMGGAALVAGYWLRRLDVRGRALYSVLAAISIGVALWSAGGGAYASGSLVGRLFWPVVLLLALWSRRATTVMTPHYRDVVIPATPGVTRKVSKTFIVLLLVLLGLLILLVLLAR